MSKKKLGTYIALFTVVPLLTSYMIFAFVRWEINVSSWGGDVRLGILLLAIAIAFFLVVLKQTIEEGM